MKKIILFLIINFGASVYTMEQERLDKTEESEFASLKPGQKALWFKDKASDLRDRAAKLIANFSAHRTEGFSPEDLQHLQDQALLLMEENQSLMKQFADFLLNWDERMWRNWGELYIKQIRAMLVDIELITLTIRANK